MDSTPQKFNRPGSSGFRAPITPGIKEGKSVEKFSVFSLFGLTARPRPAQPKTIPGAKGGVAPQAAAKKEEKGTHLEGMLGGRPQISKQEYLRRFAGASSSELVKEYGVSSHLVDSKKKRMELGMQVAGYKKGQMPGHISKKAILHKDLQLKSDPSGRRIEAVAEKLYNQGKRSGWEAVRSQRDILGDMMKKK